MRHTNHPGIWVGDRYRLIRCLGIGGAGEVWEADDTQIARPVAVKCYHHRGPISNIRTELTMLRAYRLPGMVEMFDDFLWKDRHYLIMELVSGTGFPGKPIPVRWDELSDPACKLLETLSTIHKERIVHLDLKPDNVLVSKTGRLVVLDFGIAIDERMFILNDSEQIYGTLPYLAPERLRANGQTTVRADLYSVGAMLFRALTGQLPFESNQTTAYIKRAEELAQCPPLLRIEPSVPEFVARTVDALLSPDPDARPASASDVLDLLTGQTNSLLIAPQPRRICSAIPAIRTSTSVTHANGTAIIDAREAIEEARRLASEGDLHESVHRLHVALMRIRHELGKFTKTRSLVEEHLLIAWADIALADGTRPVLAFLRLELGRARKSTPNIVALEQLTRAVDAFSSQRGNRALAELEELAPFANLDVERRRQGWRAVAARRCDSTEEQRVMNDIRQWAEHHGDDTTQARYAFWAGFYQYRRGHYASAVDHYQRAVQLEPWRVGRASVLVGLASAELELFRLDSAIQHAQESLREAKRCKSPLVEARAEWIVRATMYRQGKTIDVDAELVEAVRRFGHPDIEALVRFTEATFAYRAGEDDVAHELASKALAQWQRVGDECPARLAHAFTLWTSRGPIELAALRESLEWAFQRAEQGIGMQVAALLLKAVRKHAPSAVASCVEMTRQAWEGGVIYALTRPIPRACWSVRMDVLSLSECVDELSLVVPEMQHLDGSSEHDH